MKDEGQPTLGLNWVLVEKVIEGTSGVKARLTVRGDQEDTTDLRTDSPTVHKINVKLFFLIAASKGWRIKTSDVRCAFLQGTELDREVYVRPPKEKRIKGIIWKMIKRAYGLNDAARGFYLELSKTLTELGCRQSRLDPALYVWYDEEGVLGGMALTHVDDILHGSGTEQFEKKVMEPLKSKFLFGTEEEAEFRYVGMQIKQTSEAIWVDQNHYLETIDVPDVETTEKNDDLMDNESQEEYRGIVGKIGWLGGLSRPDLAFDNVMLSSKLGKATNGDMQAAVKIVRKMKMHNTVMKFPNLGDIKDWSIDGFGDAGHRSLPDKISSCGGRVMIIRNVKTGAACVVSWRSKKLKRVVTSSTAAETLAANETVSEMVYIKAVLREILGEAVDGVPMELFTDSKNMWKAVNTSALVEDPRLRTELAVLKESVETKEVTNLRRVSGKEMLADCLTKKGASSNRLMDVLQKGQMRL